MYIKRETYLNRLIAKKDNGFIKVITGGCWAVCRGGRFHGHPHRHTVPVPPQMQIVSNADYEQSINRKETFDMEMNEIYAKKTK